jgi:hypothetical protein
VDPSERALFIDAFKQLNDNNHKFPGDRSDKPAAGGVTFWFKQDEVHQATHVHRGPEFLPWHREIVSRLEQMIRQINPQLSLHYWDWTQDPRAIPNANLGGGSTGTLNLFTADFMGHGGNTEQPIGEPWLSAGYYVPGVLPNRDRDQTENPADPPKNLLRSVSGSPIPVAEDNAILNAVDYADMRLRMERAHDKMHGFVNMGGAHFSFRDPFVFLLHSNVDRLFTRWQTDPAHPERLDPETLYGSESNGDVVASCRKNDGEILFQNVNHQVEPWSTGHSFNSRFPGEQSPCDEFFIRPWFAPENEGNPHTYKHPFHRYSSTVRYEFSTPHHRSGCTNPIRCQ